MAQEVCMGATMQCSFGAAPSTLIVVDPRVATEGPPAANIMDYVPMTNIPPFGMCSAPTNPAVIAAAGVPQTCVPVIPAPWAPGAPTVLVRGMPALNNTSKCMCTWAGVISIVNPGTTKEMVP